MRTLSELAESYEQWAVDAEALADQMMVGFSIHRKEIQEKQLESAQMFLGEAERLRQLAARLRENRRHQPPLRELPYFQGRSATR